MPCAAAAERGWVSRTSLFRPFSAMDRSPLSHLVWFKRETGADGARFILDACCVLRRRQSPLGAGIYTRCSPHHLTGFSWNTTLDASSVNITSASSPKRARLSKVR